MWAKSQKIMGGFWKKTSGLRDFWFPVGYVWVPSQVQELFTTYRAGLFSDTQAGKVVPFRPGVELGQDMEKKREKRTFQSVDHLFSNSTSQVSILAVIIFWFRTFQLSPATDPFYMHMHMHVHPYLMRGGTHKQAQTKGAHTSTMTSQLCHTLQGPATLPALRPWRRRRSARPSA